MTTEPILCSQCGASLEIPTGVAFVSCKQCGSALRVKHDATVAYTEVVEKLSRATDELADHVAALRYERELERIDREWERERQSLMMTNKRGQTYAPSVAAGIFAIVIGGGFGLFWTATAAGMGAPAIFPMFGVVFIILAVGLGISSISKAGEYQRAERAYRRRRAEVRREDD